MTELLTRSCDRSSFVVRHRPVLRTPGPVIRGLRTPGPVIRGLRTPEPVIRREGIRWTGGIAGTPLRVHLTFENPASVPTHPASATVEVAGFGAFLPWKPLLNVPVPAIPPGGRRVVTAVAAGDRPEPEPIQSWGFLRTLLRSPGGSMLPLTMMAVARAISSGQNVHFVGNLNVYVTRDRAVERHVQQAVGLRPGATNLALFMVGDRTPDGYSFEPDVDGPGWQVEIAQVPWGTLVPGGMYALLVVPPSPGAGRDAARIAIRVRRASTGQEVPVEFVLLARPGPPKCYVL